MTPLCQTLGIALPIMQAGMSRAASPELAAAVTDAGGLGVIGAASMGPDEVRARIARTRALTDGPFAVNFLLVDDIDAPLAAALELAPAAVSLFWGDAAPFAPRIHEAGARLIVTVGSVEEARQAADAGADVVVAQGMDAGGHVRGTVGTFSLVPQVVDALPGVPVAAAGGIADARGVAAAICLGAQGVWVGTRFLAAEEADLHEAYRARVLDAVPSDLHYSDLFDVGWADAPGRVIRNATVDAWERAGRPPSGQRPGEGEIIGRRANGAEVPRYAPVVMEREATGRVEETSLWAGQGVGLVTRRQSAAEIVAELAQGARRALGGRA